MFKKALMAAAVALPIVANATIMELDPTNDIVVNAPPPNDPTTTGIVTYQPNPATRIWYSDDASADFNPQDALNIQGVIEVLSSDTLTNVFEYAEDGGETWSYTAGTEFNYMAVHFDNQQLVWYYDELQTAFDVQGLTFGFSNARAYVGECLQDCGGVDPRGVSEPGIVALLSMGLIGLFVQRRRNHA